MSEFHDKWKRMAIGELERSRLAIQWGGILGLIAHPLYYLLWTYVFPGPYDSMFLRFSAAALCIPLILQSRWPSRFDAYLLAYWHFSLIYLLPFIVTYLTIKNDFSTPAMMTQVMMAFIMALCLDSPLLLFAYVAIGIGAGFAAVWFSSTTPFMLRQMDVANLAILPSAVLCAMAFSYAIQKGRLAVEKRVLVGLAGSIAHEMRNPLSQLKYSLDGIRSALPVPTMLNEGQTLNRKALDDLYSSLAQGETAVKRGLQVITMTLNEVSGKAIDPVSFELVSAAKASKKAIEEYSFETDGDRSRVKLDIRQDFTFRVNETIYVFLLFNLIKNALYYFKLVPHASITITVDGAEVRVRDTGPGIPHEVRARLFTPFATSGKTEGTGLGLAYCRRAMLAFDGYIRCDSVVGEFTEFVLGFPAILQSEIDAEERTALEHAGRCLAGCRVLVVDDIAVLRRSTKQMLGGLGMQLDEAEDGMQVIERLRHAKYDLVIMDISMPVLDGYAAVERIRRGVVPEQKHVPIIGYSAEGGQAAKVKAEKVGMNGFISKPCARVDLLKCMQAVMERAATSRAVASSSGSLLEGKVILIADDQEPNRKILAAYLKALGMTSLEAEHGNQVIQILEEGAQVDAVLLDMEMPGMGGVATARYLRSKVSFQGMPLFALTANSGAANMQEALDAGMNAFLTKPIDIELLQEKLTTAFGNSGTSMRTVLHTP